MDVQPTMIAWLKRRATRASVLERGDARLEAPDSSVVHEMPAPGSFLAEVAKASKPGASVLFA